METEASSHLWPSQRAGYLLEGRGLITTRWAKSAQMVLLKLLPSTQRPAPPEVSWQHKGPHFAGASPTPCLTPLLPCHPFKGGPSFNCNPDVNSCLKITLEPPSLPCLHPGRVWRVLTPNTHLDLWQTTSEETLIRLDKEHLGCPQKPSPNIGSNIFLKRL